MPIQATPAAGPKDMCCEPSTASQTVSAVSCEGQNVLAAPVDEVRKQPILSRMKSITVAGAQQGCIEWTMRDKNGNPVDLQECLCLATEESESSGSSASSAATAEDDECPLALKLRFQEYLGQGGSGFCTVDGEALDAANGVVKFCLTRDHTKEPGVFFAEAALVGTDDDGNEYVYFSNIFYIYIERGQWSAKRKARGALGPPSIMEIRLHLRDTDPSESFLLDNIMFSDAEIALAVNRQVEYWNEIPPPIGQFTTQTFPFRYHWLEGICGDLFRMVAEQYRRNNLTYAAGGVQVNDQDKEPNYEQAAQRRLDIYKDFVKRKKAEINLNMAWGEVGSTYRYTGSDLHLTGRDFGRN